MASRASSSQGDFSTELHRHSSISSTDPDIPSYNQSPLESPNGSVTSIGHIQPENVVTKPMMKSSSMEFRYHDESESDGNVSGEPPPDQRLTRRDIHSLNEQRRRDQIKQGYSQLMELVPTCRNTSSGNKPSRAVILQRSIDYILYLYNHAAKHQQQIDELEKEVQALKIMKENYEQIARIQHPRMNAQLTSQQLPNYIKFHVFRSFSDELFQSFTPSINTSSFETLSSCIINWLEDHCKPQTLREMMIANLHKECTAANPLSSSSHPTSFHRTNN